MNIVQLIAAAKEELANLYSWFTENPNEITMTNKMLIVQQMEIDALKRAVYLLTSITHRDAISKRAQVSRALELRSPEFEVPTIEKPEEQSSEQVQSFTKKSFEWIVNNKGEVGIKVEDQFFYNYKGEPFQYDEVLPWRKVNKRECGETMYVVDVQKIEEESDSATVCTERVAEWAQKFDWNT